mmetsp:Transcript_98566/g.247012  ORF Transcript_98566/g.247012 Transcript_98566/m.247012 type:complete len:597 (-) Transcript_98566:352-2142(-)
MHVPKARAVLRFTIHATRKGRREQKGTRAAKATMLSKKQAGSEHAHQPPRGAALLPSPMRIRTACRSHFTWLCELCEESATHVPAVPPQSFDAPLAVFEAHRSQLLQLLLRNLVALACLMAWPELPPDLVQKPIGMLDEVQPTRTNRRGHIETLACRTHGPLRAMRPGEEVPPESGPIQPRSGLVPPRHLNEDVPGNVGAQMLGCEHRGQVVLAEEVVAVAVRGLEDAAQVLVILGVAQIQTRRHKLCPCHVSLTAQVHGVGGLKGHGDRYTQMLQDGSDLGFVQAADACHVERLEGPLRGLGLVRGPGAGDRQGDALVEPGARRDLDEAAEEARGVLGGLGEGGAGGVGLLQEGGLAVALLRLRPRVPVQIEEAAAELDCLAGRGLEQLPGGLRLLAPIVHCWHVLPGALERPREAEHLEEEGAALEDVGLGGDVAVPDLGRQGGADGDGRAVGRHAGAQDLRDAEVDDHRVWGLPDLRQGVLGLAAELPDLAPGPGHEQDVGRAEVEMHDAARVHVGDGAEDLPHDVRHEAAGQGSPRRAALLDHGKQLAARAVVQNQEDALAVLVVLVQLDDVGMVQATEMLQLVVQLVPLLL